MKLSVERPQQGRTVGSGARGGAEMQADAQLYQAAEEQLEQAAMLDAALPDMQYGAALAAQLEAKHEQVERIEDRLENLIESQASRLQRTQMQQPGLLAFPATRAQWQQQVQQQRKTMQRLLGRLERMRKPAFCATARPAAPAGSNGAEGSAAADPASGLLPDAVARDIQA